MIDIVLLDQHNRKLRNGGGFNDGRAYGRLDLWWFGIRFKGLSVWLYWGAQISAVLYWFFVR